MTLVGRLAVAEEVGFLGHGRADDATIFVLDLGLFAPEKVRLGRGGRPHRLVGFVLKCGFGLAEEIGLGGFRSALLAPIPVLIGLSLIHI